MDNRSKSARTPHCTLFWVPDLGEMAEPYSICPNYLLLLICVISSVFRVFTPSDHRLEQSFKKCQVNTRLLFNLKTTTEYIGGMAEWLRRLPAKYLFLLQSADGDSPREFESHFRRFFLKLPKTVSKTKYKSNQVFI